MKGPPRLGIDKSKGSLHWHKVCRPNLPSRARWSACCAASKNDQAFGGHQDQDKQHKNKCCLGNTG